MSWYVEYYKKGSGGCPVREFLDSIKDEDVKAEQKIMSCIAHLKQKGRLPFPFTDSVKGVSKLRELRVEYASNIYRVFYFPFTGKKLILLHGFVKKTRKTPKKEIEIAKERMVNYVKRQSKKR